MNILSEYENLDVTCIFPFNVSQSVELTDPNKCDKNERQYELLAWNLNFSYKLTNRHRFFAKNNYPDMSILTDECFSYWNERRKNAINPGIKLRYSELIRDFKSDHKDVYIDKSFFRDSIKVIFQAINGNYIHESQLSDIYQLMFDLIRKNFNYLPTAKRLLKSLVSTHVTDEKMMDSLNLELKIINNHWECFDEIEKKESILRYENLLGKFECENKDFLFYNALSPILDYYNKKKIKGKIYLLIKRSELLFKKNAYKGMRRIDIAQRLQELYKKYQFKEDFIRLKKDIQEAGKEVIEDMEPITLQYTIKKSCIDSWLNKNVPKEPTQQIPIFLEHFIPRKGDFVNMKNAKLNIFDRGSIHYFDEEGHPTSVVGSFENDLDSKYMQHLFQSNCINSYFMYLYINQMIECGTWSYENVIAKVLKYPFLSTNSLTYLDRTIKHYFNEEYVEFCYLVIPQIEYFVRHVVEQNNGIVIKDNNKKQNEGFQLKTLDDLLREPIIRDIYDIGTNDDSVPLYLRFVLTNDKGLNLRNRLCHGLEEPSKFDNRYIANQLMHILLFLTNWYTNTQS